MSTDYLQRLLLDDVNARCVWVRLDAVLAETLSRSEYPGPVAELLSRSLLVVGMMSSGIKFDGRITLQLQSRGGPLALLMADCTEQGGMRGIARLREGADVPATAAALFARLAEDGILSLTLEPSGRGQRWQGVVPLEGNGLEAAISHYFEQSEQLPTRIRLAVAGGAAAGLMVQKLPGEAGDEDGWGRVGHLLDTVKDQEMLGYSGEEVLHRLFHAEQRRLFPPRSLHFHCPCTRERVADVLQGLGSAELESLAAEQEVVEVRCEFCNEAYRFDRVDLTALIQGDPPESSQTIH